MQKKYALLSSVLLLVACTPEFHQGTEATSSSSASSKIATSSSSTKMPAKETWRTFKKPSVDILRTQLTPLQFEVTQNEGTETPYANEYWNNHDDGIYVDVVSGEPLFSSKDKYESGTGWPSFTKPLIAENITQKTDTQLGYERTEVRSVHGGSHLGHVFTDGPMPLGLRYCMNSAAMRFIPKANLRAEGYEEFAGLFE